MTGCIRFIPNTRNPGEKSQPRALAEPDAAWSRRELKVCWENVRGTREHAFEEKDRKAIEAVVGEQFTKERTGIWFTGWKDCPERLESGALPDVMLVKLPPEKAWSIALGKIHDIEQEKRDLGEALASAVPDMSVGEGVQVAGEIAEGFRVEKLPAGKRKTFAVLLAADGKCQNLAPSVSRLECIQAIALHEFGHVAGLRHEHAREEALFDLDCYQYAAQAIVGAKRESRGASARTFGSAYDSESIMNYCYLGRVLAQGFTKGNGPALSPSDLVALKSLYPVRD